MLSRIHEISTYNLEIYKRYTFVSIEYYTDTIDMTCRFLTDRDTDCNTDRTHGVQVGVGTGKSLD